MTERARGRREKSIYYSTIAEELLPFMTTWMDLESIRLRKISQEKLRTILFHSHLKYAPTTHGH